jgi:hypothetical protein
MIVAILLHKVKFNLTLKLKNLQKKRDANASLFKILTNFLVL